MKKYPHIGTRTEILREDLPCLNPVIGAGLASSLVGIDHVNGMFFQNERDKLFLVVRVGTFTNGSVTLEIPVQTLVQSYSIAPVEHELVLGIQIIGPFSRHYENTLGRVEVNFSGEVSAFIGLGRMP